MHRELDDLMGKEVEVRTPDLVYRGRLIEVSEELLFVRGQMTVHQIPMDRVADVRLRRVPPEKKVAEDGKTS